jgi:hypothetical protein
LLHKFPGYTITSCWTVFPSRQIENGMCASLSADLREAFPDMHGLSPRNRKYVRAFAPALPERAIVQEVLAQITWHADIGTVVPRKSRTTASRSMQR